MESVRDLLVGTVRGHARILVRPAEHDAGTILRLRRLLPRVSLLRYRDLAQDGSELGPERDAVILPNGDPRHTECVVDLPPGAAIREYRLEWQLNPDDHSTIGVEGREMLLFSVYLVDRGEDGAEKVWPAQRIIVRWEDAFDAFARWWANANIPESLQRAWEALRRAEIRISRVCELCRERDELDLLLAQDRVWECSAAPELEEARRMVVLRELTGISRNVVASKERTRHHHHEDLTEQLAAARERQRARLIAYAPPRTGQIPSD